MFPRVDEQDGSALDLATRRDRMVDEQIVARGIVDPLVERAMRSIPRERFVPPSLLEKAYDDGPLPIGHGQTISQPYIVAYMISQVSCPGGKALEVGTGCGYFAAVLSRIAREVWTVEIVPELAAAARERLARLGSSNVHVRESDGSLGWPEAGPFDTIVVSCGARAIPRALVDQLAPGGRLICPVGPSTDKQQLEIVAKDENGEVTEWSTIAVRFVPLTGPGAP